MPGKCEAEKVTVIARWFYLLLSSFNFPLLCRPPSFFPSKHADLHPPLHMGLLFSIICASKEPAEPSFPNFHEFSQSVPAQDSAMHAHTSTWVHTLTGYPNIFQQQFAVPSGLQNLPNCLLPSL